MSGTPVNERHAHHERVNRLVARLSGLTVGGESVHVELLNVVNEAYAQGYRDADPDNRREVALPDDSTVIMDGAGRVITHIPPRTILEGTVSGRFRTYVMGGHLHVWDIDAGETIAMIEMNSRVAFNMNRVDGTHTGQRMRDQELDQVADEVRSRWAASRALPPPHRIVCLPHDFVAKLRARGEGLSDDHAVLTGIANALDLAVDQLDAWTEWDAQKGWR